MSDKHAPLKLIDQAADRMGVASQDVTWCSMPEVFGSTSGPHGGIGGQTMTSFQVYGFMSDVPTAAGRPDAVMFCAGKWRVWRCTSELRWSR